MRRFRITVGEFRKTDWQRFNREELALEFGECESACASLMAN